MDSGKISNSTHNQQECSICLEPILSNHTVGKIANCCNISYHDKCLITWSQMSNSCPTCRKRFHKINISSKSNDKIIHTIQVKDKLLPNGAINDIPSQFIIPPTPSPSIQLNAQYFDDNEDEEEEEWGLLSASGVCCICSSSIYSNSYRNQLITCRSCFSKFHLHCLGVSPDQYLIWNCPICDCHQECVVARNPSSAAAGRRRINSILNNLMGGSRRSRSNLVIHNENDELDIDFLYENNDDADFSIRPWQQVSPMEPSHTVINGGVIRRREEKQRLQLTEEEKNSWSLFEQARNQEDQEAGIVDPVESSLSQVTSEGDKKRRRRKKMTPLEHKNPEEGSSSGNGRITSLINQLKAPNQKSKPSRPPLRNIVCAPTSSSSCALKPPAITAESPGSSSPQSNSPMESSSYSNDSDTQYESDTKSRKRPKPAGLNLEQKVEIQNHIKNVLRPLYKPGSEDSKFINTEEEYIRINKTISRKIYSHILTESIDDTGEISSTLVDNYFDVNIPTKLKEVVDMYINKELNDLSI
ncbi:uncharacterized protein SPAPADRAFT_150765 [Spathaspora passalidarum NRRL Y-27907]|uniref:PHD-type domain-containing protein n=1 Tax=Spathaspora passalidarum (strain NRRL Y-27907 / 11-Y1) TaxID=619300 RepID=G3AL71_SPAPN|nr:uncharacterized protein SPAPADRAFT_150765 [Spathaspora passalidarum NRRL Y-27907]EGW33112.1 hypothetical protein SPAPADRAFT_150765 [Spathaspora passalidarum NRRL Y-27907]